MNFIQTIALGCLFLVAQNHTSCKASNLADHSDESLPPSQWEISLVVSNLIELYSMAGMIQTSSGYKQFSSHQLKAAEFTLHIIEHVELSSLQRELKKVHSRGFRKDTSLERISKALIQKFNAVADALPVLEKILPDKKHITTLLSKLAHYGIDAFSDSKEPRYYDELASHVKSLAAQPIMKKSPKRAKKVKKAPCAVPEPRKLSRPSSAA